MLENCQQVSRFTSSLKPSVLKYPCPKRLILCLGIRLTLSLSLKLEIKICSCYLLQWFSIRSNAD